MKPSDTSQKVQEKYDDLWRNLSFEERLLKGFELVSLCQQLIWAGYKMRYPDLLVHELQNKMMEQIYFKKIKVPSRRTP